MDSRKITSLLLFHLCMISLFPAVGQITAPGSSGTIATEYTAFAEQDNIHIYCTGENGAPAASLQAETNLTGTKTFLWEKYNPGTGSFDFYFSESSEAQTSVLSGLEDGGYRVTITLGGTEVIYRAWVFNNQLTATASTGGSDCESLTLLGEFTSETPIYYDPASNAPLEVRGDIRVEWLMSETILGELLELPVSNPPAGNTEYVFRVYDRFGCEATATIQAEAGGPVAAFSASPMQGEAPLTVTLHGQGVPLGLHFSSLARVPFVKLFSAQ